MLCSINSIDKSFGSEKIIEGVSLSIDSGQKIGFIGNNGTGKSTLLKIIAGEAQQDGGSIWKKEKMKMSLLSQDSGLDFTKTLYEAVLDGLQDLKKQQEKLNSILDQLNSETELSRLEKLSLAYSNALDDFENNKGFYFRELVSAFLRGLGFSDADFDKPCNEFSGGQKMRAALAKALLSEPDLLLLDEPTNFLDTDSLSWLEGIMASYEGACIVVSHDRYFLDRVAKTIWHIERGFVNVYNGNYTDFLRQKNFADDAQNKAHISAIKEIIRQKEIIQKLKSFNREKSVRAAESREKKLAKMDVPDAVFKQRQSKIEFKDASNITKTPLRIDHLSCGYLKESPLISQLSLEVGYGDKIGIVGRNAAGKTTLFKTIMGELRAIEGEVIFNGRKRLLYIDQEHASLNPNNSAVQELVSATGEDSVSIRSVLGVLGFEGNEAFKEIGNMSGGEKSRVDIAKLMLTKSSLLLLDEPTNHLDIPIREAFEEAVSEYLGSALIISHDRYLLSKLCNRIVFIENRLGYVYNMPYEEAYLEHLAQVRSKSQPKEEKKKLQKTILKKDNSTPSKNELYRAQKRLDEIVHLLDSNEEQIAMLEAQINSDGFFKDNKAAQEAVLNLDYLKQLKSTLEEEWLRLSYFLDNDA